MKSPIRFLLADDHSLIRQGLIFLLEDLEVEVDVVQASTLGQTLSCIQENPIDIAVVDAQFPDGSSLSILPNIKNHSPETRILIFSGVDESQALKFINAGAHGFLSKLSEEEEISRALQKMIHQGEYLSENTQSLLLDSLRNPHLVNPLQVLTERELEVCKLYAEGLGNLEIANKMEIKQNTVSTMKKRIFEKLKVENMVDLIEVIKENT